LLFNFSGNLNRFRIGYEKLAHFLPVAVQRYASKAREQLATPFSLLCDHGVINSCTWTNDKRGRPKLVIEKGRQLRNSGCPHPGRRDDIVGALEDVEVRELRSVGSPAYELVSHFHRLWTGGEQFRPTGSELAFARELLGIQSKKKALSLLPIVVERLKTKFPTAKTFGATRAYWAEAERVQKRKRKLAKVQLEKRKEATEFRRKAERESQKMQDLLDRWNELPEDDRHRIESRVMAGNRGVDMKALPHMFRATCLLELENELAKKVGG
jgi:hypothetical protein